MHYFIAVHSYSFREEGGRKSNNTTNSVLWELEQVIEHDSWSWLVLHLYFEMYFMYFENQSVQMGVNLL